MRDIQTKPNMASVKAFIDGIKDPRQRKDAKAVVALMKAATGKPPKMWGPAIVGFDRYTYKYASGKEGESCLVGFSPRKGTLTLYVGPKRLPDLTKKLGKHKVSGGCLHIKRLDDVDVAVLKKLVAGAYKIRKQQYA